jgi:hypothetical protein
MMKSRSILNQMKTFDIIALIPNPIENHIHFNNPKSYTQ